jgi:putative tricarboxylic transport membrane protein
MKQIAICAAILVSVVVGAAVSQAQSYPTKPIEFVVHTAPGGGSDLFARLIADSINKGKLTSQPVVVVNKAGGGGAVALNYVAERKDPHTIFVVPTTTFVTAFMRAKIQAQREDYRAIAMAGVDINVFAVREESAYKTAKDLAAAAKAIPKGVVVGFGSVGATGHMVAHLFARSAGIQFNYLSHKSGGDAVVALLGGRLDMVPENPGEMLQHVKAKKVRIIAVASDARHPDLPGVPTLKESGYPAVLELGRGFMGFKNMSNEAVNYLGTALKKVFDMPSYQGYLKENMMRSVFLLDKEFGAFLDEKHKALYPVIEELGLLRKN